MVMYDFGSLDSDDETMSASQGLTNVHREEEELNSLASTKGAALGLAGDKKRRRKRRHNKASNNRKLKKSKETAANKRQKGGYIDVHGIDNKIHGSKRSCMHDAIVNKAKRVGVEIPPKLLYQERPP